MKHASLYSLLLLVILVFLLTGCSDKSSSLARTWMVENLKYTKEIPADMQPAIDNSIAEMRNSFRITYNADGTYQTIMKENTLQGKWKLNWNSSKLSVVTNAGDSKQYDIVKLDESSFIFKALEGGEEVIFEMVPEKTAQ